MFKEIYVMFKKNFFYKLFREMKLLHIVSSRAIF